MHADQMALQRPAERHCVVGVAEREILPRAVQRGGACHCGERQRSVVGEAVVWAGAEVRYGHPERIAPPSPVVSAKCLRLNRPLLTKLLSPPANCTKPVMVPLLMMLVLLLRKNGR